MNPPVPPFPPPPQRHVPRPRIALHLPLTLVTLGLWWPIWALMWWSADAHNAQEADRYRRDQAVYRDAVQGYREAVRDWQWRQALALAYAPRPEVTPPSDPR